jgi:hypothetical protein
MPHSQGVSVSDGRRLGSRAFVPLLIGIIALYNVVRQPRFEAIHTVDVLQMVGSGMCFGVALLAVIVSFRGSGNS